eukprot:1092348-Prymnesium_polylepis.1
MVRACNDAEASADVIRFKTWSSPPSSAPLPSPPSPPSPSPSPISAVSRISTAGDDDTCLDLGGGSQHTIMMAPCDEDRREQLFYVDGQHTTFGRGGHENAIRVH